LIIATGGLKGNKGDITFEIFNWKFESN